MAEDQTAGTTPQDGGDAAKAEAGTPDSAGRDAESKEPDYKKLYLEDAKPKIEELNRLKAERQAYAQPPPAADAEDDVDAYYAEVERQAAAGQPWAKAERQRLESDRQRDLVLRAVFEALPDEHKAPIQEYAKNPGKYGTLEAAKEAVRARNLEAAQTAKDAEIAKLRAELARATANRVDPNTVPTDTREGSVSQNNNAREMTRAEWKQRQDGLSDGERRREQSARLKGEIVVRG